MKIAVTGANGFLGAHLVKYIEDSIHECVPIQRTRSTNKNIRLINNIDHNTNWDEALNKIEVVIHCAGIAHKFKNIKKDSSNPYFDVNFKGTKKLVKSLKQKNIKKIVFISSIKVNGEKTEKGKPFTNFSPLKPKGDYAISKYISEKTIKKLCKNNNIEYVIIRPTLIYGPGVKGNFLKLLNLINSNFPLPFGAVNNKRSLIYVNNLSDFILTCATSSKANGKTFLISDNESYSSSVLIDKVKTKLKAKSLLLPIPQRILTIFFKFILQYKRVEKILDSLEVDCRKSCEILGWEQPFSSDYGLKETVKWFKSEIKNKK